MESLKVLKKFQEGIIKFLDELIEQFPTEGDLIILRIFFNNQISMLDVMSYYIREILPLKEYVKNRDSQFFLNNNILFNAVDKNKVNHFKRLWSSNTLDNNDREIIWKWFEFFNSLSEKYQSINIK